MAKVSLSQAAKDTGVSLPTLSRWRKSGKISADKNGSGGYVVDTSEYDRIKGFKKDSPNMKPSTKGIMKEFATPTETPNEMKVLQVEVEVLRERIKDKNEMIEDLKEDRNEWKKQAQTLLLQPPTPNIPEKPQENEREISATPLPAPSKTLSLEANMKDYIPLFGLGSLIILLIGLGYGLSRSESSSRNEAKQIRIQEEIESPVAAPSYPYPQSLRTTGKE